MKKSIQLSLPLVLLAVALPAVLYAGDGTITSMHDVLDFVREDLSKRCEKLVGISSALGGFGALFYIGNKIWKNMAEAQPVDFYPLLRPFCLLILIGMFPTCLDVINGLLQPITDATAKMASESNSDVLALLKVRAKSIVLGQDHVLMNDPTSPAIDLGKYRGPATSGAVPMFGMSFITNSFSVLIKLLVSSVLQLVYYAAALCIDVMRTFHLAILAVLGPLVFAISIFDGFNHTLVIWLGRYINIYLWLPIANLFSDMISSIQKSMLMLDIAQVETGGELSFTPTDATYIIFLMIAIIGYFSVPSIANFVVHASGGSAIMQKVNGVPGMAVSAMSGVPVSTGGGGGGNGGGSMSADLPGPDTQRIHMADASNSEGYNKDDYQRSKLRG
jgi:conjugative transposon TraJ protein